MARRADAGVGVGYGVGVRLHVVDELLERVRGEVLARDDGHRDAGDEADRHEILDRIEGEVGIERGGGRHADVVEKEGVAVGRGLRDLGGAESAAGAADVLHHDLLAEHLRHRLGDEAGHGVGGAARRERHDDGDRAGRVVLGRGGCRKDDKARRCREARKSHGILPFAFWPGNAHRRLVVPSDCSTVWGDESSGSAAPALTRRDRSGGGGGQKRPVTPQRGHRVL